jgi:hypothetical protein
MTTTLGAPSPIETSLLPTPRRCASKKRQPVDLGNEAELLRGGGLNYPGKRS